MKKLKRASWFIKVCPQNKKYLGIVNTQELFEIQRETGISLGISHPQKKRPCLFWKVYENSAEYFIFLFLTSSRRTPFIINLKACPEKQKLCSKFPFQDIAYGFVDSSGKLVCLPIKRLELIEEIFYCGPCEDFVLPFLYLYQKK